MGRTPCCDRANVKRGPWSPEEDAALKHFLQNHGIGGSWTSLPQKAGLRRCGKSCRLRWLNYLRPDIKHGDFTDEEDNLICTLYTQLGSRWSFIASQMPGRTDNDVKNYWNTKLKKKLFAGKTSLDSKANTTQNSIYYSTTNPGTYYSPTLPCDDWKETTVNASNATFSDYLLTPFSTLSDIDHEGHVPYGRHSFSLADPFQLSAVDADIKPIFESIDMKPALNSHLISSSREESSISDSSSLHMDSKCNVLGLEDATAGMFMCEEGFFAYDDFVHSSLMNQERANEVGSNCFDPSVF